MRQEKFDDLVGRLDAAAARSPFLFRVRTALWLLVGYFGIALAFIIVLSCAAGMFLAAVLGQEQGVIFIWLGLAVLVFGLWMIGRVTWSISIPPKEVQVTAGQVPQLFAVLRELAAKASAPMFHCVHVSEEMNASVFEMPRFGLPFWRRRHLVIGLPLMSALTEDEFRAVLAHEFGHLSPQHRRFSGMIYRLRRSWERIFEKMEEMTAGFFLGFLRHFVRWFWPRFNAHAFVLSRTCEYEADAAAARHVGPAAMSQALTRFRAVSRTLDESFWAPLWREASTLGAPPAAALQGMMQILERNLDSPPALQAFEESKRVHTTNADTHPCLRDRLTRLGTWNTFEKLDRPLPLPQASDSAASRLLGPALPELWNAVGSQWAECVKSHWEKRHARARLLRPFAEAGPSPRREEEWQRVSAVCELQGDEAAEPLLTDLLLKHADHGAARLVLGRLLLRRNDSAGLDHLKRAVKADRSLYQTASDIVHDYYWRLGDAQETRKVLLALDQQDHSGASGGTSSILPHSLGQDDLVVLLDRLRGEGGIAAAHLGMVPAADGHSLPMLYLCLSPRRPWWRFWISSDEESQIRRLSMQVNLPGRTLVFAPAGRHRKTAREMMLVPGTRLDL
ncbi:M48 family metallopeptidase [Brevifollis gellanilyticus]|uniref:Peptidase M48 domain-containing protein n=1 Tax=Brevifollis gellanilyticus TaxID=748831 RepID=A0A512M549_9BACT|nr:M48 family metalloprotease [Brevifollis gellanilyticus]GEP41846.1 hypothetical protein BGE01nite_11370 [Brevifollis gellanilyticus]